MTNEEYSRICWIYFKDKHPEIGQQVCIEWCEPYSGETDCVWDGDGADKDFWNSDCVPIKWKPVQYEI